MSLACITPHPHVPPIVPGDIAALVIATGRNVQSLQKTLRPRGRSNGSEGWSSTPVAGTGGNGRKPILPGPSDPQGVLAGLPHTTGRSASRQGTPTGGSWYRVSIQNPFFFPPEIAPLRSPNSS